MNNLKHCIIADCPNEANFITKYEGRLYHSCKEHKKSVTQIIVAENKINKLKSLKSKIPKWMEL